MCGQPNHTTIQLRGRRARAAVSSKLPYCWLSSWRVRFTSDIHWATGLHLLAHSWRKPPPHPMTSWRWADGISNFVVPVVWLCSAMNPTNLPILFSIQVGSESAMMCSAKACDATFSLVRIIIFNDGSTVISPAIIAAAALVFPAPNTPLIGQSVLPSSNDKSIAERVARKWPSRLWTRGWSDNHNCFSSSVASWSSFVSTSCISQQLVFPCPVAAEYQNVHLTELHIPGIVFPPAFDWKC